MIDFLRGRIVHREPDYVVLEVRDVGYRVFVPNPYALGTGGEPVVLYVHHHIREDAMMLYGFPTREEQAFFRMLIEVPGIGPKMALGILASGRPEAIAAAVRAGDAAYLTRLPGVGRKTAQRLILDLKDKLAQWIPSVPAGEAEAAVSAAPSGSVAGGAWTMAREALLGLGYREYELDRVWHEIRPGLDGRETPEQLIRRALQHLDKG
ncbi:MAG: Holliday junction DNA helicase RuvA [Paenibacillaceae bacterium ZCTH02-B3]|nr:MAG: Holliday junction DNA helicase RuvA [Paenibacillaceae bacterium ZCTH02-B3]